ncbi:MAG: alkaline phosphatase family protein, partial [Bryobacteraceae bacterium]
VQDVLVRLDRDLGELFEQLDAKVGRGNYVVAFSADHGVAPIPEQAERDGLGGGRLAPSEITAKVDELVSGWLGESKYVAGMVDSDLSFSPGVYQRLKNGPGMLDVIVHEIESMPGVARVFRAEQLYPMPEIADPILRAAALSYVPGRSGDLIIVQKPYWIFSEPVPKGATGGGTTHGSPYGYDQRVPVIFYGWGVRPGMYLDAATPADIAPTLAYLCRITLAQPDGHVLAAAIAAPAVTRKAAGAEQ